MPRRRPSHTAAVASGVASGDCHGSGAQCGGIDRVGVVVVLRAPVKWSPPAAAGCVEPSLRPRVRALAAGCASSPHSDPGYEAVQLLYSCAEPESATFFYPQGGLSQHAHQVAQAESFRWAGSLSPPTRSPKQNSADCWLLATGRGALRSSDRLQIAQIYGTAEICKTGIQQPLTAAYDFRQIPAGGAMRLNEIEIGDQDCGTLLNLRSHSTQAYEMRPAHVIVQYVPRIVQYVRGRTQ
eukprot:COSAG01_NODE_3738_length_5746_cov_133.642642_5_plen_239_part_00